MASNEVTTRMLRAYIEDAPATSFLSSFFVSPPENFHNSEKIEIDIERDGEDVAIVIQDLSAGSRENESSVFTNKEFTPPIYDEEGTITSFDLIKRTAGNDPFMDPNFQANASLRSFRLFRKLEKKIRRAIELQASQVLQTGTLSLTDSAGNVLFTLDYSPKTTHFPTSTVPWTTTATSTPIDDLESLADVINVDGKMEVTDAIFGREAMLNFQASAQVQTYADNRRYNLVQVDAPADRAGGKFHGVASIGQYRINLWSYTGHYVNPVGGADTKFVTPDKVILVGPGRLDLTFGAIPRILGTDSRALPFLPPRIVNAQGGMDLTTNAWVTPDGRHLKVSAGTRPLCIPTAIDTYGCLDTVA